MRVRGEVGRAAGAAGQAVLPESQRRLLSGSGIPVPAPSALLFLVLQSNPERPNLSLRATD